MTRPKYEPILFCYDISVFSRRCDHYLTLRQFEYVQCHQPNMMPRPDLERLGIAYRRIPLMAIGRDVYCDSKLIIEKLERLFPENTLGSTNAYEQGLETIIQTWIIDGGPFWRTASLIPPDVGVMLDAKWTDDRQEMTGRPFDRDTMRDGRKDGYSHTINNFSTLEHGLLADGRKFIFATDRPTLVDVHAVWPFAWAIGESMRMGEHLDPDFVSETHFPRVYAWVKRFTDAVDEARTNMGPVQVLSSDDTVRKILESDYYEKEPTVDELDPLQLRKGDMVKVYPVESGFSGKDKGRLVGLCKREVVIESKVRDGEGYLRLHFPRYNFKIEPLDIKQ